MAKLKFMKGDVLMTNFEKVCGLIESIQSKLETMSDGQLAPVARKMMGQEAIKDCQVILALLRDEEEGTEDEEDE